MASTASIVILLSGCVANQPTSSPAQDNHSITVEYEPGSTTTLQVNESTGAILGQVRNDAGDGLRDASVALWGSNLPTATTNETGWFRFTDLSPQEYRLRADFPKYQASEAAISVTAGQVARITVVLLPLAGTSAGERPHSHDYWAGRTEVTVIDHDFEWEVNRRGDTHGSIEQKAELAAGGIYYTWCGRDGFEGSNVARISFPEGNQLVWAGTRFINVTLTWNPVDYVNGNAMALSWRPPNGTKYYSSTAKTNGQTHSIPVAYPMWDNSHQAFTLWEFNACLTENGEGTNVGGARYTAARWFTGKFHAKMILVGGHEIPIEPAHPSFWENGSFTPVINETKVLACSAGGATSCAMIASQGRMWDHSTFRWAPKEPTLVPPGTGRMTAWLSWTYSGPPPVRDEPLGLSFSPANVPPASKSDVTKHSVPAPDEIQTHSRRYTIQVTPGENDGFYQQRSNWAFYWSVAGQEHNQAYAHGCACDLRVSLQVIAYKTEGA